MTDTHIILKDAYPEDTLRKFTHIGIAHFAKTGPKNMTCRQCLEWSANGYYAKSNKTGPTLKPGSCDAYTRMMNQTKKTVPYKAASCKYFVDNSDEAMPVKEKTE